MICMGCNTHIIVFPTMTFFHPVRVSDFLITPSPCVEEKESPVRPQSDVSVVLSLICLGSSSTYLLVARR